MNNYLEHSDSIEEVKGDSMAENNGYEEDDEFTDVTQLIFKHPFWTERIIKMQDLVQELGGSQAVVELCFTVINIVSPLCVENYAYSF